ncbi:MAG: hypothetical protein NTY66_01110 [Candidatus Vogelbacteria bacterium]|nr:hypothetical protein [Candidatus Vogelbacteria bacterium]
MKKLLTVIPLLFVFSLPTFAQASIFDEFVGAVRDLQKQVVDLVSIRIDVSKTTVGSSSLDKNWKTFADPVLGFEVRFPTDWSTSTVFTQTAKYKNADAFIRNSRADFLSKIVKPSSTALDIAVQDSAVFISAGASDDRVSHLNKWIGKVSTSTKQVGSSTALYILHSEKTDSSKFGGGSTEKYVFANGSTTIVAEANYSSDAPGGPVKAVFDKMLLSLRFTVPTLVTVSSSTASTTAQATSTEAVVSGTSTIDQAASVPLSI